MKKHNILVSETFSRGKRRYFLDYKIASNRSNYICFTRSDAQEDGTYHMERLRVFQEDFEMLIGSFSSLMTMAAHYGQGYDSVQDMHLLNQQKEVRGIKGMEAELRPREKMLENGPAAMTDTELLAMLIGSGTPSESAIDLAYRILGSVEGNLQELSVLGFPGLCRFAGMGIAKSSSVMAAMELGRRLGRY
ncbi:UPF0758 domain-containing protein [Pedobacter sp. SG908]|uniref:UPF0758 domain-containing protein n=1 Tax=Pedobacter sp. SG908 TaxID=2587135 RepID=UPI00141EE155|nr:UPF0758 domain-containing protein [Pedobacter sp. SG908]NII83110.1 hypothetical protein [Pedobacter sp. SG908]